MMCLQVKRQDASYDGRWTPRPPQPPPLNRMRSFGRRPYYRSNVRPWSGQRQGPMVNDYAYPAPRPNSGRRRPGSRDGPPGDFYSNSYDDAGQGAYPDYIQPYEYDNEWPIDRRLPYDDREISRDEATDPSDHSKFTSAMTTVSGNSNSYL